jgi:regulator of cell morphogenesis and NO signaling
VFHQHGLDFCCKGRRSLADACRDASLDAQAVLHEIDAHEQGAPPADTWATAPLPAIVEHIVGYYHARIRAELPELVAMAQKVETVHAEKPTCPRGLTALLQTVHAGVLDHLAKEEHILFPLIVSGRGAFAASPIRVMELEHAEHGENLGVMRELTDDLTAPPEACGTWRALYTRLGAFEAELMEHIHLENYILFQRALVE